MFGGCNTRRGILVPNGWRTTTFRVVTDGYAAARGPLTPGYTNVIPPGSAEEPTGIRKSVSALSESATSPDPEGITFD